jgi:molecular chaperone GrpE
LPEEKNPLNEDNPDEIPGPSAGDLLAQERKRSEDILTRLKYAQADLENYRKRAEKEAKEAGESALRDLAGRLLVVFDELELAIKHMEEGEVNTELKEGFLMVERKFLSALESAGVQRIECVGKPFNPELHEAVEKVQGRSKKQDIVIQELRSGFTFRGQVLRPSMVKVELATKVAGQEAKASE